MKRIFVLVSLMFLGVLSAGCSDEGEAPPAQVEELPTLATNAAEGVEENGREVPEPTLVPTDAPPTFTPEPLAATVNDRPITLADFERELARYEQAQQVLGSSIASGDADPRVVVLNTLVEQAIIEQAAEAYGIEITPEMIDAKIAESIDLAGGSENFQSWLDANQLSEEEFATSLKNEMLTAQVVAQVTADVPTAVEQVRARYIQVDDPALAQSLLEQARAGADFATLAQNYSLDQATGQAGGDLGFFAPGSLLVPEIETAAFDLAVNEISAVITVTRDGRPTYYLVQMIERDPARALTADQRSRFLQETFENWLDEQVRQAEIVTYIES